MKKEIWICDKCGKEGKAENAAFGLDEADWAEFRIVSDRMNRIVTINKHVLLCKQCADKFTDLLSDFFKKK